MSGRLRLIVEESTALIDPVGDVRPRVGGPGRATAQINFHIAMSGWYTFLVRKSVTPVKLLCIATANKLLKQIT